MSLLAQLQAGLAQPPSRPASVPAAIPDSGLDIDIVATEQLPAWFDVSGLASASMACAAEALAKYATLNGAEISRLTVDQRLASAWFGWSLRPQGWELPGAWDDLAGDYAARDGWIKLHTNAPHHRAAALAVLGEITERAKLAKAVAGWSANELEAAIVNAGGCAAALRSRQQWLAHEQGSAVQQQPLVHWQRVGTCQPTPAKASAQGLPLTGLKVLDLTRVLAGPVAGRFLAGYGADVLRIDPPSWEEPGVVPEVTLGKRCAGLDLHQPEDRKRFAELLADADLLLHGYRADALVKLGYDRDALSAINANLIDVSLNAYGWAGSWQNRRGFDSLVQMSSGIAAHGRAMSKVEKPVPLPVQALDHATGYLLAGAALQALCAKQTGTVYRAKTSLARVAALLQSTERETQGPGIAAETATDIAPHLEQTAWGPAQRVRWPISIATTHGAIDAAWSLPASELRSVPAAWAVTN